MHSEQLIRQQMNVLVSEVEYLIRLLYVTHDVSMKHLTLNQLWNKVEQLKFLTQLGGCRPVAYPQSPQQQKPHQATLPANQAPAPSLPMPQSGPPAAPSAPTGSTNQQTFTREQLAQFNGKNGRPAYVAVKGVVYDVTHNAAWSAATHFGLAAGQELTREFASCHAAEQWILNTLTPVGRLVD
ncbi:cytochrome b5 domain-containing protein [Paenibacillus sp. GCM10012303]|uniref:cytochrome b5 domain-containing protein n=1 Tax=Paenibacillus sp. GCM10012303 TaxID=3317340 RepID=UPI00361B44E8